MKKNRVLRIGFDLDGVLLYNPARIARPVIVFVKKLFLPKEKNKFHLPKTRWQKLFWLFLHKSSFMAAPGIEEIRKLVDEKKIKPYIISARYEFLKTDFENWTRKIDPKKHFEDYFHNDNNQQPHLYKSEMIKKLKLDIFIDDNWDIVDHLSKKTGSQIFWIYNFLDRKIDYQHKYATLKKALQEIKRQTGS